MYKLINNKNKGITLIALIVTIIIMLILAGITISIVINGGLINQANEAKINSEISQEKEVIGLGVDELHVAKYYDGKEFTAINLQEILKSYNSTITVVDNGDNTYTITYVDTNRSYIFNLKTGEIELQQPLPTPEIGTAEQFDKSFGVIDIVWLSIDNKVISNPLSPADNLGGMTAVKWDGSKWIEADTSNNEYDWFNYEVQNGSTEEKGTSKWANAKAQSGSNEAFFVWIPRYAYKITYFNSNTNAENYRKDRSNLNGVVGYSTINGMLDNQSGTIIDGTTPSNINGKVQTMKYSDYIPHPAFEFVNPKAGIWIGKFESNTNIGKYTRIIPNIISSRNMKLNDMFDKSIKMKESYELSGDTHMMKNIEWGAVAYLADSKFGRNGTNISVNTSSSFITGSSGTKTYDTKEGVLTSTTGNIYGIYDMSGGAIEYVAAYIDNSFVASSKNNTSLIEADNHYKDIYKSTDDSQENNYFESKSIYGDAVYETSTSYHNYNGWYNQRTMYPSKSFPVFSRGGSNSSVSYSGIFNFYNSSGVDHAHYSFRIVYIP